MLPVEEKRGLADEKGEVELSILLTEAVVRTDTENEIVLGTLGLGVTRVVTLGVKVVRVGVDLGVAESHVGGGNNHGALGDGVILADGERLLDEVGDHEHRRAVAEELTNNGTGVGHGLELLHVERGVDITVADLEVLLTDTVEDIRALSHNLEEPSSGGAGGVLGSEEEGEDGLGDLVVGEVAEQVSGLLHTLRVTAGHGLAPPLGVNHLLDPGIHDAGSLASSSHADLALRSALGELGEDHISRLLAIPRLGVGNDDGEVDKLESGGDEVVVVGNLLDSLIRNVVADEGTARDSSDDLTEVGHEGNGLSAGVLGDVEEGLEVAVVHLLLSGEVDLESAASEEAVETLAELDVGGTIEENPIIGAEQLVGDIDDAGLDITGAVEDLTGHIASRGNDDEPVMSSRKFLRLGSLGDIRTWTRLTCGRRKRS